MHWGLTLLLIVYSPLPCQTCLTRLVPSPQWWPLFDRLCATYRGASYGNHDGFSETVFSITLETPGFSDDCIFKEAFREGAFVQFSCKITFPALTLHFARKSILLQNQASLEALSLDLVNVSANSEANMIYVSQRPFSLHMANLKFPILRHGYVKEDAKEGRASTWKRAVIARAQTLANSAYLQHNTPRC
nr:unnamed protein product [Spirometra erinaceieuropaei]